MPYLVFGAAVVALPRELVRRPFPARTDARGVLAYSGWIAIAMGVAAVYERLDIVLLGWFRAPEEVGVYSAALALATIPDFVVGCVATVLHPRVMPAWVAGEFGRLRRHYLRWAAPLAVLGATGATVLAGGLVPMLLSARYVAAVPLFQVVVLGVLFSAVVTPLPSALLAMAAPARTLAIASVALASGLVVGLALIPAFGAAGAAAMFVIGRVLVGVMVMYLGSRMERAGRDAHAWPARGPLHAGPVAEARGVAE
jgi:O-antigen/teichoic acid export membrane protein